MPTSQPPSNEPACRPLVASPASGGISSDEVVLEVTHTLVDTVVLSANSVRQEYTVQARNAGGRLLEVSGEPLAAAAATKVVSGNIRFGDLDAGAVALADDTLSLEHDCGGLADVIELTWRFFGTPGEGIPADPGPAGEMSLEGIDSDGDGARDDLERIIAFALPTDMVKRAALLEVARKLQGTLQVGESAAAAHAYIAELDAAVDCLALVDPSGSANLLVWLENRFTNTGPRLEAYLRFNALFHGMSSSDSLVDNDVAACQTAPPLAVP